MPLPINDFFNSLLILQLACRENGIHLNTLQEEYAIPRAQAYRIIQLFSELNEIHDDHAFPTLTLEDGTIQITSVIGIEQPMSLSETDFMALKLALGYSVTMGMLQQDIMAKILQKIEKSQQQLVNEFEYGDMDVYHEQDEAGGEVRAVCLNAIRNRKELHFQYYTRSRGEIVNRHVQPFNLQFSAGNWYLRAFDLDRDDWRTFRLERMKDLLITNTVFNRNEVPRAENEGNVIFKFEDGEMIRTVTRFYPPSSKYIIEFYPPEQVVPVGEIAEEDKQTRNYPVNLVRDVIGFPYYREFVLQWGRDAEVIEPEEYRDALRDFLSDMLLAIQQGQLLPENADA